MITTLHWMNTQTLKNFLNEEHNYSRPYYKATDLFLETINKVKETDKNLYQKMKNSLLKFKNEKTLKPGDWASQSLNDHSLSRALKGYCEFHLVFGKWICLYKHHGRFIILVDIVKHSFVENDKVATQALPFLNNEALKTQKYVENKLKTFDEQK